MVMVMMMVTSWVSLVRVGLDCLEGKVSWY
jgi:hypothetical protein